MVNHIPLTHLNNMNTLTPGLSPSVKLSGGFVKLKRGEMLDFSGKGFTPWYVLKYK